MKSHSTLSGGMRLFKIKSYSTLAGDMWLFKHDKPQYNSR